MHVPPFPLVPSALQQSFEDSPSNCNCFGWPTVNNALNTRKKITLIQNDQKITIILIHFGRFFLFCNNKNLR